MALWLGFGFSNPKPGQSHHEAIFMARLGLAYLGLAWPGSWPQAGPGTSLVSSPWYVFFSLIIYHFTNEFFSTY
jgi:hypothetical protein